MKTQIKYPTGLSITVEHDEQFAPQLLEVHEGAFSNDLVKNNERLQLTLNKIETENNQLILENRGLKEAIKNIEIINNDNIKTITALRTELSQIFKDAAPEIPTRHVSPSQQENFFKKKEKHAEKSAPKWSKKPCANCGHLFQPTGPRSSVCPDCKAAGDVYAAGEDFTENPE